MFDIEHIPQSRLTQIKEDADRDRYKSAGVRCVELFAASRVERLLISRGKTVSLGTILLIVLVLILIGAVPTWPYSRSWGYAPSGVLGLVVVVILVLLLLGRL
jgi:hypothetical protein